MKKLFVLLLSLTQIAASPINFELARKQTHENGCSCKNLPRPINEYDFVFGEALAEYMDVVQYCAGSGNLSEGTISYIQSVISKDSVIKTDSCSCPDRSELALNGIYLARKDFLQAISIALQECKENLTPKYPI